MVLKRVSLMMMIAQCSEIKRPPAVVPPDYTRVCQCPSTVLCRCLRVHSCGQPGCWCDSFSVNVPRRGAVDKHADSATRVAHALKHLQRDFPKMKLLLLQPHRLSMRSQAHPLPLPFRPLKDAMPRYSVPPSTACVLKPSMAALQVPPPTCRLGMCWQAAFHILSVSSCLTSSPASPTWYVPPTTTVSLLQCCNTSSRLRLYFSRSNNVIPDFYFKFILMKLSIPPTLPPPTFLYPPFLHPPRHDVHSIVSLQRHEVLHPWSLHPQNLR